MILLCFSHLTRITWVVTPASLSGPWLGFFSPCPGPRAVTTGVVRDPGTPVTSGDTLRVARLSDRNCDRGCLRPTAQSDGKLRDTETCFLWKCKYGFNWLTNLDLLRNDDNHNNRGKPQNNINMHVMFHEIKEMMILIKCDAAGCRR